MGASHCPQAKAPQHPAARCKSRPRLQAQRGSVGTLALPRARLPLARAALCRCQRARASKVPVVRSALRRGMARRAEAPSPRRPAGDGVAAADRSERGRAGTPRAHAGRLREPPGRRRPRRLVGGPAPAAGAPAVPRARAGLLTFMFLRTACLPPPRGEEWGLFSSEPHLTRDGRPVRDARAFFSKIHIYYLDESYCRLSTTAAPPILGYSYS